MLCKHNRRLTCRWNYASCLQFPLIFIFAFLSLHNPSTCLVHPIILLQQRNAHIRTHTHTHSNMHVVWNWQAFKTTVWPRAALLSEMPHTPHFSPAPGDMDVQRKRSTPRSNHHLRCLAVILLLRLTSFNTFIFLRLVLSHIFKMVSGMHVSFSFSQWLM